MKLFADALTKFFCGFLLVGFLIFLPAGTLAYAQGWLLMGLLFVPMLIAGFVMFFKSPDFLRKRLDAKEVSQDELASRGEYFSAKLMAAFLGFKFVDAADWDIEVTFDGVHYSEKGHQTFAEQLFLSLSRSLEVNT